MSRRGVILAGGVGSRLFPLTLVTSKQLLPIYDKPMIYYPLTTLMLAGVREYAIISTPSDLNRFEQLLGTGDEWGLDIHYRAQEEPRGIADALIVAEDFIEDHPCALILGDNFFYGHGLTEMLIEADQYDGATIFGYQVTDPERYGIVVVADDESPVDLVEKPNPAPSNWAVTGLYFYDDDAVSIAKELKPSERGELEITDVNREYLRRRRLRSELLYRGFAWLDTGTHSSLHQASAFVQAIQERQGVLVASPEEVAYRMGFIEKDALSRLAEQTPNSLYRDYLMRLVDVERR